MKEKNLVFRHTNNLIFPKELSLLKILGKEEKKMIGEQGFIFNFVILKYGDFF